MFIYMIRNKVSGKMYIGQTVTTINTRMKAHRYASRRDRPKTVIAQAIKKHGWDRFDRFVLEQCSTREELNEAEKYWIARYDSVSPNGYNVSAGGDGSQMPESARQKLREANLGKTMTEEVKRRISASLLGRRKSEETRRRMSESQIGREVSEETRKKLVKCGAKLTWEQVRTLREMYATGDYLQKDLATMFGITKNVVGQITRNEIWKE